MPCAHFFHYAFLIVVAISISFGVWVSRSILHLFARWMWQRVCLDAKYTLNHFNTNKNFVYLLDVQSNVKLKGTYQVSLLSIHVVGFPTMTGFFSFCSFRESVYCTALLYYLSYAFYRRVSQIKLHSKGVKSFVYQNRKVIHTSTSTSTECFVLRQVQHGWETCEMVRFGHGIAHTYTITHMFNWTLVVVRFENLLLYIL